MKPTETKATGRPSLLRHLHAPLRHLRSNIVAYLALAVAVGSGGSYALAATSSNGTVDVCVDNGSGVMHLAKHPRCGRHQSRVGLSSALDRPTVSAWAAVEPTERSRAVSGASMTHAGIGRLQRHRYCRKLPPCSPTTRQWSASTTANRRRARRQPGAFPVAWTEGAGHWVEAFTIHTGVVVNGAFQPRDEPFNFTDSCG